MTSPTNTDFPFTPTSPTAAPAGYITPGGAKQKEPPKTPAQIASQQNNFLQFIWGGVTQAVQGFVTWGEDTYGQLQSWANDLWGMAQSAVNQIETLISEVGGTIINDVAGTIITTESTLSNLVTGIVNGISHSAVTEAVVSDVEAAFHELATDVHAAMQVGGQAYNAVQQVVGQINTAVSSGAQTAWDDFEQMAQAAGSAVNSVISTAANDLGHVRDVLTNAFGVPGTGTTNSQLAQQSLALATQAQAAEASAIAAQYAVAQMNQAGGAQTPTGLLKSLTFTGTDQASLSSTDWSATSTTGGSLVVCVGSNNTPSMGISTSAVTPGTYFATSAYTYTTDNQSFEAVLAAGGSAGGTTYLLFHCNASFTAGGYLAVSATGLSLGSFTQSGGAWTFNSPIGSLSVGLSSGNRVEVENQGNVYQLLVNGVVQETVTDTGNAITLGSAYRSAQVLMQRVYYTYNPGTPWATLGHADSFQLAGVLLSDYIVPTYLGSTAHITRTSSTVVAAPSGVLPTNFWAANLRSTPDITVDLVNGKFTVSKAGPYLVTASLESNAASNFAGTPYAASIQAILYRNGSIEQYGNFVMQDKPVGYDGSSSISIPYYTPVTTFECYLSAGDYVQIGTAATVVGSSNSITGGLFGEATGKKTYFNITRLPTS